MAVPSISSVLNPQKAKNMRKSFVLVALLVLLSACVAPFGANMLNVQAARAVIEAYNDKFMQELLPIMCGNTHRAEQKFLNENHVSQEVFDKMCNR